MQDAGKTPCTLQNATCLKGAAYIRPTEKIVYPRHLQLQNTKAWAFAAEFANSRLRNCTVLPREHLAYLQSLTQWSLNATALSLRLAGCQACCSTRVIASGADGLGWCS